MKKHKISVPTALMLMLLAVVCTFNITFFAATEYYNARLDDLEEMESRYSKLKSVADIVDKFFVADYDQAQAIEGALAGYVDGLDDQWSAYYTAEETAAIEEDEANSYVGIGVTYSTAETNRYEITSVTAGGPADKAGLLPGDKLISADGVDVSTLQTSDELAAIVKGEAGTVVDITVQRGEELLSFAITREAIRVYSVTSKMLEGQLGYIAISDFDSGVDEEFASHLTALLDQGAKGLIFDVRNNPGGYLSVMRSILDRLLPEGIVITTVDKAGSETPYTPTVWRCPWWCSPMNIPSPPLNFSPPRCRNTAWPTWWGRRPPARAIPSRPSSCRTAPASTSPPPATIRPRATAWPKSASPPTIWWKCLWRTSTTLPAASWNRRTMSSFRPPSRP